MNAFHQARRIEAAGMDDVLRLVAQHSLEGRYVTTDKGRLSELLQKTAGDVVCNAKRDGRLVGIEVKCERRNRHGNLFLETWSNYHRLTVGWLVTLRCDVLMYRFLDEDCVHVMDLPRLQRWAFEEPSKRHGYRGRVWDFPEKLQATYDQPNDTWGRCVPLAVLEAEVGCKRLPLPALAEVA